MSEQSIDPQLTLDDWLAGWRQVDYARCGRTEVWVMQDDADEDHLVYVGKHSMNKGFEVYARLRECLGMIRSETNYRDLELTSEQFAQGVIGQFTVPYDQRTKEEQQNPPEEERCRQDPSRDYAVEESKDSSAS